MSTIVKNTMIRFVIEQGGEDLDLSDIVDRVLWESFPFDTSYLLTIKLKPGKYVQKVVPDQTEDTFWGEYATSVDDNRSY